MLRTSGSGTYKNFLRDYLETKVKIELNEQEKEIVALLKTAMGHYPEITLRFTGGWVRDRLLNRPSNDIDIAVQGTTGLNFARAFANINNSKVHIVQENPEQSKHLETAIINFNGYELQFTGFRKETYNETRIPEVEVGTIEDDAKRRDFSINALYWNLRSEHVENYSGGLQDLNDGIIRTPVDPLVTFKDDPLRILRAIRFSTRFNFQLAPEITVAARNPEIQTAFRTKVSRERIEIETRKMIMGNDPVRAIRLLSDFGLLHDVFQFPPELVGWDMDQGTPHHELNVFEHTLEGLGNLQRLFKIVPPPIEEERLAMNYAIIFHDLGKLNPSCHGTKTKDGATKRTYYNHERYSLEAAEYVLERLNGTPRKTIEHVKRLITGSSMVNPSYTPANEMCGLSRKALCKFIRFCGDDWRNAITVNMADATAKKRGLFDKYDWTYHQSMIQKIQELNPHAIMNLKPLLNGDEVFEIIGGKKDKRISEVLERLLEYQFSNPKAGPKEALKYVKQFRGK